MPRTRFELVTQGFSVLCSTTELSRLFIIQNYRNIKIELMSIKMKFIFFLIYKFLGVEGLEPSRSIKPTDFLFTTILIVVRTNM
jgi:hypothetical protein